MSSPPPDDEAQALDGAVDGAHPDDESALISNLFALIEPGPDGLFGDRGLEGFLGEFFEGFRGDPTQSDDWSKARRFRRKYLTTASLGRLISNIRQNSDRALQGVLDGLTPTGDNDRRVPPVVIDAAFLREHGLTLGTALLGAVTSAIVAMPDQVEKHTPDDTNHEHLQQHATHARAPQRRPHVPYRVDVVSIAQGALASAAETGRGLKMLLPSLASRAPALPALGEIMALATTMLARPMTHPSDGTPPQTFPGMHANMFEDWSDDELRSDEFQASPEDDAP